MTKLIVTPVDPDAPGSFRQFQRLAKAMAQAEEENAALAFLSVSDIVLENCKTDDGTPVEDVLDELSLNQFMELLQGLSESSVPTESADS